jgi:steroid 5-alpha reductase family enzyme
MIVVLIVLIFCYLFLFILWIKIKDNSIVDVFWGLWFLIISIILIFQNKIFDFTKIITFLLVFLWSVRISSSILSKKLKHKWEDNRYAKWRQEWNFFYTRSFFQIYLLQMLLLIIVSIPLFIIFESNWWNIYINILAFIISFVWLSYETIADLQIKRYINSKEKKPNYIFTWWLWKYSRHPNYLWEIMFWLWITIISIQFSFYWIIWLLSISFLLLFVSWVPLKENYYKNKDNYEEYIKETPIFIPNYKK